MQAQASNTLPHQQIEQPHSFAGVQPNALSFVEAAHINAVLHATVDRLALVGAIKVDPLAQAEALTKSVGREITRMLEQQKELEDRFQALITEQHALRGQPNRSKLAATDAQLHATAEQLRVSTAQLCRNLKDNPNVTENMAKVATERVSLQQLLLQCCRELDEHRQLPTLAEFVVSQERRDSEMRATMEHERITSAAVKQLRTEIREEKAKHDEELRAARKALKALNEQLKQVTLGSHAEQQYRELEVHAANECQRRAQSMTLEELQQEASLLKQQIGLEERVHQATADYLGRQAKRLREDALGWATRLDTDVAAKEHDIETVKADHQRDLARLKDAKEVYEDEVTLREEREAAERAAADKAAADEALLGRQSQAAIHIQAIWRGHVAREALKKGGKDKKGKGGKTKKK